MRQRARRGNERLPKHAWIGRRVRQVKGVVVAGTAISCALLAAAVMTIAVAWESAPAAIRSPTASGALAGETLRRMSAEGGGEESACETCTARRDELLALFRQADQHHNDDCRPLFSAGAHGEAIPCFREVLAARVRALDGLRKLSTDCGTTEHAELALAAAVTVYTQSVGAYEAYVDLLAEAAAAYAEGDRAGYRRLVGEANAHEAAVNEPAVDTWCILQGIGFCPAVEPALADRNPFRRALWLLEQRGYPLGYIPEGAYLQAVERMEAGFGALEPAAGASKPIAGAEWEPLGPAPMLGGQIGTTGSTRPMSGRVSDVVVDPRSHDRWLIGTAQGGVWETTDGGGTWTPRSDREGSLSIGALAIAPSDPDVVYAGTGEAVGSIASYFGVGLLKSIDGGKTWTLLAVPTFGGTAFSDIRVHPADPDVLVVATGTGIAGRGAETPPTRPESGVLKSTDGGASWVSQVGCDGCYASDLEVHPADFTRQYVGFLEVRPADSTGQDTGSDGALWRTADGEVWAKVDGPWTSGAFSEKGIGRIELAIAPSNPDTLYVSIGDAPNMGIGNDGGLLGLWRTNDAWAETPRWTRIPTGATDDGTGVCGYCGWKPARGSAAGQCWYDHEILVDPLDADTLYAGGIPLWKCSPCTAAPVWTEVSKSASDPVNGIHVDQHAMAWAGSRLIVGNDGGAWSTTDGGATWNDHNAGLSTIQFYDGVLHPTDPNLVIGGSQDNGTAVFEGSSSWTWIASGDGADNAISSTDPGNDWTVSSQRLTIFRTTDGGTSFQAADDGIDKTRAPFIARFEKCPCNDDLFIAGTDDLWRCDNFFSAETPTWRANGLDLHEWITALAFAPSEAGGTTYAVGSRSGGIYLTTDGGDTWSNDIGGGVPDRYVTDMAFDPTTKDILYVTLSGFSESTPWTPGHVFRTATATATSPIWKDISPSDLDTPHNTILVDRVDPDVLYVGTDVGVLFTDDGGGTWLQAAEGLPNVAVFDLAASNVTGSVVAFTFGRGAWRLAIGAETPPPCGRNAEPIAPLVFHDRFGDSGSGWSTIGDDAGEAAYEGGGYAISSEQASVPECRWAPVASFPADFVVDADARVTLGSTARYGVVWGKGDEPAFAFMVDSEGRYRVITEVDGAWPTDEAEWRSHLAIARGEGVNRLRVTVDGDSVAVSANGVPLETVASPNPGTGRIGLVVWADSDDVARVRFDNLNVHARTRPPRPDRDGDGVPDDEDFCPDFPGSPEGDGC